MTTRYETLQASFIEWDDPTNAIITYAGKSALSNIRTAEIRKRLGLMDQGKVTLDPETNWEQFIQEGRICSLYQHNRVKEAAGQGMYREMGSFLVEKYRHRLLKSGKLELTMEGAGPEKLLGKYRHFRAIGEENIHNTTLADPVAGPYATTLLVGAPKGNESCTMAVTAATAGAEDNDEIQIELDDSYGTYVGKITNADPWGDDNSGDKPKQVAIAPRTPYAATAGNDVHIRKCRLKVALTGDMQIGQLIEIQLNGGGTHTAKITFADPDSDQIEIDTGFPSAASAGNWVKAYDYSQPALDDVEQIMDPAVDAGWTLDFENAAYHGTANGTTHAPMGESAWELLEATAKQSGEFWRIAPLSGGFLPRKKVLWRRTHDSSGMVLYLRAQNADVAIDTENVNRGVMHSLEKERMSDLATRIYPTASDGRITLEYCTETAQAEAAAAGFTIVLSTDAWRPDYIEYNAGVAEHGVLETVQRYGNISLTDRGAIGELQAAADAMLRQAMTTVLEMQKREFWRVVCHVHRPLFPGQTVVISNTESVGPQTGNTFYIHEVVESYSTQEAGWQGVVKTSLLVSAEKQQQPTPVRVLARELQATKSSALRLPLATANSSQVTASVTTVGGGGGTTDHGLLTGLTDDDHPQYLLANGTRALSGNLTVNTGVTVDGVDISAHAADANAHHATASAYDNTLEIVSGQAFRVKRPTNSGVAVAADGVQLSPGTLTSSTTNSNSGSSHYHLVTAYSDLKTNAGHIAKADASGDSTWRYLTADKLTTPAIASTSGLTVSPGSGTLTVAGSVSLSGGARFLGTSSDDLTLNPADRLILNPTGNYVQVNATLATDHHASGFLGTGWGIDYDGAADFRSIYADELHVAAFIADTARVAVGAEYITPSMAIVAEEFTVPALGASGTLVVEDAPGLSNLAVFADNDYVLLRVVNHGAGLIVANIWGQVSGYVDQPDGKQSWTFTTRLASYSGIPCPAGTIALDFGKSGDGWWWVTTLDTAGAPYAGISTWHTNPYTDANRTHWLRLGQLKGVSGVYEWGLQAGATNSRKVIFSDARSEIHGARLSLYAGNDAKLQLAGFDIRLYRDGVNYSTLTANADHSAVNVLSTAGNYYSTVDEGYDTPSFSDYIYNASNSGGHVYLGLTTPTAHTSVAGVQLRTQTNSSGISTDTLKLYAQVFAADEVTPLTGEVLVTTRTTNSTVGATTTLPFIQTNATTAQWTDARIRFRWEYLMSASVEAIRLDPSVPSIGVGQVLPTGYSAGGDGFWVGNDSGTTKLRIGSASGAGLRWTGTAVELRNSAGSATIALRSDGTSEFSAPMTLGTSGGIWQGGGTFASPTTGLKVWNDGGVGRLATYSGGTAQVYLDTSGKLLAGAGAVQMDADGLLLRAETPPTTGYYEPTDLKKSLSWVNSTGTLAGFMTGIRQSVSPFWRGVQLVDGSKNHKLIVSNTGVHADSTNVLLGKSGATVEVQGALTQSGGTASLSALSVSGSTSLSALQVLGTAQANGLRVGVAAGTADNAVMTLEIRTGRPASPSLGSVKLYAYKSGSNTQLIIRNAGGTDVVIGTIAYV